MNRRILLAAVALLVVCSTAVGSMLQPPAPWRGYGMDEGAGSVINPSGAGVTGTIAGGVLSWGAGHTGLAGDNALKQMGGGFIDLVESYGLGGAGGDYTISVWAKHGSTFSGNESLFGGQGGAGGPMLKRDSGGNVTWNQGGTTWTSYAAGGVIGNGQWHNYVLTYQNAGTVQHLYIDGVDTDTWEDPYVGGMGLAATTKMTLFNSFWGSAGVWGGYDASRNAWLDDFAVWKGVLSAENTAWLGNPANSINYVPEPGTLALLGCGGLGLLVLAWRKRK